MALFGLPGEVWQQPTRTRQLLLIPEGSIRPNPNQPRKTFDEEGIRELSRSIEQAGLIQPLTVRRVSGGYELIAGERRLRACRLLGMKEIPCIVQQTPQEMSAMMALIENIQRRDLHYIEEAECYRALLMRYGMTQEQLAARLGKSQSFIANKVRLLTLSPAVRQAALSGALSERHARALLKLQDEALQLEAIRQINEGGLTVKETERLVERMLQSSAPKPRQRTLRMLRDYRIFVNTVRQAASLLGQANLTVEIEETEADGGMDMLIRIRSRQEGAPDARAAAQ